MKWQLSLVWPTGVSMFLYGGCDPDETGGRTFDPRGYLKTSTPYN